MNPFICGSFSRHQMEDDIDELLSPCSTPKRSRKSRDSNNPYSNRGLDKFYALVAELEDKKQKIYTQKGSEDISFVRFAYSRSNNWKPIVVKVKGRKQDQQNTNNAHENMKDSHSEALLDKHPNETTTASGNEVQEPKRGEISQIPQKQRSNWTWKLKAEYLRCPCVYLPIMIVLILLFLVTYGRSFAILCTSVGWYLVPMISKTGSSCPPTKRPKKKEYARRFSEKSIVHNEGSSSPNSVLNGPADKSPAKHAHRQSW